jgi:hypothetical protein
MTLVRNGALIPAELHARSSIMSRVAGGAKAM